MNTPPDTLLNNRYRIERMLGQGGMGAVYLAFDTALDAAVAVKVNQNPAPQSSNQFLREARLLASLRHPNLPRVTDYFILSEAQYLVMDYVAGKDLNTILQEEGVQPLERVLGWVKELTGALSYLHRQNPPVIHRDIKPANVRLSAEGQVMLVDFGIAKVYDPDQQTTTTGAMGYTPGYAPPEQYGGAVRTGPYTDQYSLAALIYHLLTGQKPADSVQRALGVAGLAPLSQVNPGVPTYVQAAVERALSLRPDDRFSSVDEFLHALVTPPALPDEHDVQTVIGAHTTVSAPTVVRTPAAPAPAGSRQVQAGAAPREEIAARAAAPAPARRSPKGLLIGGIGLVILVVGVGALLASGLLMKWLSPAGTQVAPAEITQPSDTPKPVALVHTPTTAAPAAPAASATLALSPTPPPLLSDTATVQPTATTRPADTTVPTATALPLGGGGVLAFASDRGDGKTIQIWTMRVSLGDQGQVVTSDLKQLTDTPGDKSQPAWSPDGRRLVYLAPGGPDKKLDLWMMNADGSGEPQDLTNMPGNETEPAWSPDGKWIAYTSDGRFDGVSQLYLIRPDRSDGYKLSYDQKEYGPAWTPDNQLAFIMDTGMQIVFIRGQQDPKTGAAPTREFYVTPYRFDPLSFIDNLGQAAEPAFSADGKWMVYTRQRGTSNNISLSHFPIRVAAQDVIKLTDTGKDTNPSWSPDGQWIVFNSTRDGNAEVYIMRSTGKSQMNLTSSPGRDLDPDWQPAVK